MPTNQFYATVLKQIQQLRPTERKTRTHNWAWLLTGLYLSRSVHVSKIANKIPTIATLPSATRRLSRVLDNAAIQVRAWYAPLAQAIVQRAAASGEIRLIVDGSKIGFGHQLLMVGVAYRRRTLPVAWTWVRCARGHSSAWKQRALLSYVHHLVKVVAPKVAVLVTGDSEFGAVEVLRQLERWEWHYVLRQKRNHLVYATAPALATPALATPALPPHSTSTPARWQPIGALIDKAGQSYWLVGVRLTQLHAYPTNLLLHWQRGQAEPWLLATNLEGAAATLLAYRRRMWIEEMFGDFKRHGFDLESTHLRHFQRLSRLTLAVAMLYVWLIAYGAQVIKRGLRHLVDRADRRDYSVFRIGCNMVERCLAQGVEPFTRLVTGSLPKLSGS